MKKPLKDWIFYNLKKINHPKDGYREMIVTIQLAK